MNATALCPVCGTEVGISHPGDVRHDERQVGWVHAIAACWRAIEHVYGDQARLCRLRIAELGSKPPPANIGERH